jgi:hypothetical protein
VAARLGSAASQANRPTASRASFHRTSLLEGLGYQRFGAIGGDIGSGVSNYVALNPERVTAVHPMDAGVPVYSGGPRRVDARVARLDGGHGGLGRG